MLRKSSKIRKLRKIANIKSESIKKIEKVKEVKNNKMINNSILFHRIMKQHISYGSKNIRISGKNAFLSTFSFQFQP